MAQLEGVRAEQDAMQVKQVTSQKGLLAAVELLHNVITGLLCQQHEFTRWHSKIAGIFRGTASVPASIRATQRPSGIVETLLLPFKRPRPS